MHQVGGANPPALTILSLWCSPATRLPLMQEITGAKPVRDANFIGAWFTRNSRLTWLRTRQPWTCKSSRADHFQSPQSIVSDALARYASLSPVQLRVGDPFRIRLRVL